MVERDRLDRSELNVDYFTAHADQYITFAPLSFSWKYIEKPAFDTHLSEFFGAKTKVLDAGCGEGRSMGYLIEKGILPENVTAIDANKNILTEAKKKYPESTFIHGSIHQTDLSRETFDLIISTMVLDYLGDNLELTLNNFHKWLKKEGTLFFIVTHPLRRVAKNLSSYQERGWRQVDSPWQAPVKLYHRTTGDFINQTINAGFRIERVDEPNINPALAKVDPINFANYFNVGASRLAIKAKKI